MMKYPTKDSFLKDIEKHQLTVKLDDGIHRCLLLQAPGTNNQYFHITTWADHLCFSGDMGCFVFQRSEDMFKFFRTSANDWTINPDYWSEKVEAVGRYEGVTKFSVERFQETVTEDFQLWAEDVDEQRKNEEWERFKDEVLDVVENEYTWSQCYQEWIPDKGGFYWNEEVSSYSIEVYTYRFIWCCYAIVWAIRQYDEYKSQQNAAA